MFLIRHIVSKHFRMFFRFSGRRSLRARVPHMTRRVVLPSKVIPSPGRLGQFVANIVFGTCVSETAKCSKSVNAFGPTGFFSRVMGS